MPPRPSGGVPIVTSIVADLKDRRILVPAPALVERFALAGRAQARRHAHRELGGDLDEAARERLDALLTDRADWDGPSLFGWIGEVPEGPSQKNLAGVIERLRTVRAIGLSDDRRKRIHANRYAMIAREAKVTQARELLRVGEMRRTAVLVAFVVERQAALTDLAIDMFDKLIGAAHRRAETVRKTWQLERADAMEAFARNHLALCQALMTAREDGRPLGGAIERTLGWNGVATDADGIARVLGRGEGDGLDELIGRRLALRRAARTIFDAFTLHSFKPNDPILQAVELLRSLYAGERTRLPAKVPIVFLKQRWRQRVRAGMHDFDPKAWEVGVLVHLRDRLRSGDVWVEGSRAYRTFEDYLLPRPTFEAMRSEDRLGLAVPDSFEAWLADRGDVLDTKLSALAAATEAGSLPDAVIDARGLTLSPIKARADPRAPSPVVPALRPGPAHPHHGPAQRGRRMDRLLAFLRALPHRRARA